MNRKHSRLSTWNFSDLLFRENSTRESYRSPRKRALAAGTSRRNAIRTDAIRSDEERIDIAIRIHAVVTDGIAAATATTSGIRGVAPNAEDRMNTDGNAHTGRCLGTHA